MAENGKIYDLVIIGGGPGGLTAAIYALRAKMEMVLLEKTGLGGQIAVSDMVENYPGVAPQSGAELMAKFEEQAKGFGLKTESAEVEAVVDAGDYRLLTTSNGDYRARTVIIASGAKWRKLGIPGEAEFTGRGVSYCATCDGFFFKNKDVVLVGGGDTAVKEALFLTKLVNKIHLVHRRDKLRAEKIHQEQALANPKIEFHWNTVAEEIIGDGTVSEVAVKNIKTGDTGRIKASGAFVLIGVLPNSEFIDCDKDKLGFIQTDTAMETSINGVYAVGDVRMTPLRQVATAVGDGAVAAYSAQNFLEKQPERA